MPYKLTYDTNWHTKFSCDLCGTGKEWFGHEISMASCRSIARNEGWTVGTKGWLCPKCKPKRRVKHEQNKD